MAIIKGDREGEVNLPKKIEELVSKEDPVRIYDKFIDSIDMKELNIKFDDPKHIGPPSYEYRSMVKLIVYGYSYGIRSSRKLERACYHNISFIWLMGNLKPDFKTISNFRKKNKEAFIKLFKMLARFCFKIGLIEGNVFFCDGTKIRANASIGKHRQKKYYEEELSKIDKRIEDIMNNLDIIDSEEEKLASLSELKTNNIKKENIEEVIKEFNRIDENSEINTINSTDKECVKITGRQGTHAGYNTQIVVDDKCGLIVSCETVNENNDSNQLSRQIEKANEVIEKKCDTACADGGYNKQEEILKLNEQNIKVIVPTSNQASKKPQNPFHCDYFKYDEIKNEFICPEGHSIIFKSYYKKDNANYYKITSKNICFNCKHFGKCTKNKKGRVIKVHKEYKTLKKISLNYKCENGQYIYKKRKTRVENIFGFFKGVLGYGNFLLRGLSGVNLETSIFCFVYNLKRLINMNSFNNLSLNLSTI